MANLRHISTLQLLCVFFTPCLSGIISADVRSVHPGENITLPCDITNYYKISWYRLRSDKVKQVISVEYSRLRQIFQLAYNLDKKNSIAPERSTSSLVIIGVRETDLGFYYCGGWNKTDHTPTQFGNFIRLDFTGISPAPKNDMDIDHLTEHQDTLPSKGAEFWILVCVCPVSILINLICVFGCIFKGKSLSSCIYSTKAVASNEK
ncbi:uncharacterized protein DAT39_023321, partial [Clarias magur]